MSVSEAWRNEQVVCESRIDRSSLCIIAMDSGLALQEFLEYVLGHLIARPDMAGISHEILEDGRHLYRISLDESDIGRVIGRNGYTISAIRSLMKAAASRNHIQVRPKILRAGGDGDDEVVG